MLLLYFFFESVFQAFFIPDYYLYLSPCNELIEYF